MCLFPTRAEKQEYGRPKLDPEGSLQLPCGKCSECKTKRAVDWATRCKHEAACHDENCFITLTYDDENLPSYLIVKDEFQKFIKKLRKAIGKKVKYIVSHEYGSKTGRPHHHVIIFGWNPSSQEFLMEAPSGEPLFTSKDISKLWRNGYHSIGEANEKTAFYIASYSLKSNSHDVVDPDTSEIMEVTDTMDASRRTAIGYEYFLKNVEQIIHSDDMIPRYYIKIIETAYERVQSLIDRSLPVLDGLQYIANNQDRLLMEIEQKNIFNLKNRGAHARLAKHVITEQKKNLSENSLRTAPAHKNSDKYTYYLKQLRNDYKSLTDKENTNVKRN